MLFDLDEAAFLACTGPLTLDRLPVALLDESGLVVIRPFHRLIIIHRHRDDAKGGLGMRSSHTMMRGR